MISDLKQKASEKTSLKAVALLGLLVIAMSILCIMVVDYPVMYFMAKHQDGLVREIFYRLTDAGHGTPYFVSIFFLLIVASGCKYFNLHYLKPEKLNKIILICFFLLAALIVAGIATHVLKILFGRWRPDTMIYTGLSGFSWFNFAHDAKSFPSGHSQLIWTVAVSLLLIYPRLIIIYLVTAILVSFSRVMLNQHFVSDVVLGAYLGSIVPILINSYVFAPRGLNIALIKDNQKNKFG